MKRMIRLFLICAAVSCGLFFAAAPKAVHAADQDPVVTAMSHGAGTIAFEGTSATLTVPRAYPDAAVDLSALNLTFNSALYNNFNIGWDPGPAAVVGAPDPVTLRVSFSVTADPVPGTIYTTNYTILVVRVPPVPSTFAGSIEKSVTLPTTTIPFTAEDFLSHYTQNDDPPLTAVSITGAGGAIGVFKLSGADYALGNEIDAANLANLTFAAQSAGTLTYTVYAHNAPLPNAPRVGSLTLTVTVAPAAVDPPSQDRLEDITQTMRWNSHLYLDEGEFNSTYRRKTGADLSYVRFTLPYSSEGRLYYNYSSQGSYDYAINSDERFYYRNSTPRISNVVFVPYTDYYGTVWVSYTAYGSDGRGYNGQLRVRVDSNGESGSSGNPSNVYSATNTVTYSTERDATIWFNSADFNAALVSATGYTLSYIRFTLLPLSNAGRLYYNYTPNSGVTAGSTSYVSTGTSYYRNSSPELSGVSFVPQVGYTGTLSVAYTAYTTGGSAYTGTLYIRVGLTSSATSTTLAEISRTTQTDAPLKLDPADFQTALTGAANVSLSYVMFSTGTVASGAATGSGGGSLYYNYRSSGSYDSAVSSGLRYYRSSTPSLSLISFVPASGRTGVTTFPYTAYTTGGAAYSGRLVITTGASGSLEPLSYTTDADAPFRFASAGVSADIRSAARALEGASAALSYITFDNLPGASRGTLYRNYAAGARTSGSAVKAAVGDKYYDRGSTPTIATLSLVPSAGYEGDIELLFTAYTTAGGAYEGSITVTVLPALQELPEGWARAEVESLAGRGVVPADLLGRYTSPITRAEFTALLLNTYEQATGGSAAASDGREAEFSDISASAYARQIRRAYAAGLIDGDSAEYFLPDDHLTREQAAKILCAAVGQITGTDVLSSAFELNYGDLGEVSDWALPYVAYAAENSLMIGDDGGRFHPQDDISREEAMALTERAIVKYRW